MMTMRDFLNAVIAGNVTDEVIAKATEEVTKLDEKNEKRKTSKAVLTKQAENKKLCEKILETLEPDKTYVASEVAELVGIATTSKASSMLKMLEADGSVVTSTVSVKGRKVNGYTLA